MIPWRGLDGAPEYRTETSTGGSRFGALWEKKLDQKNSPLKMWKDYDFYWDSLWYFRLLYVFSFYLFFGVHWKNQCWFTLQVRITCFWLWEVFFGAENSGRLRWWKCCSKNASKNMTRYKIYMSCVVFVIRTARLFLKKYDCGICRMERYADLPQEYRRFVLRRFLSLVWQW